MNRLFSSLTSPPLTAMIQCKTAAACIRKIKISDLLGAEAFGVQLCRLQRSERTEENLTRIFRACKGKPIYVTSYRYGESTGMSDEECMDLLLLAGKCGATLLDIPADTYDKNDRQLTETPAAVEKQKALIAAIHESGGEVLLSTHDFRPLNGEEVYAVAAAEAARGADILKVVVKSDSAAMLSEYLYTIQRIKKDFGKPVLFLDVGASSAVLRKLGGILGCAMYLCVAYHNKIDTPAQPTLCQCKAVLKRLQ